MTGNEHYESDTGCIYVLACYECKYVAVNIETGTRWKIASKSKSCAIGGLTKINGKVVFEKTKFYVKKASDIVKILEDTGYTVDLCGDWHHDDDMSFVAEMFQCCDKELDENDGLDYKFIDEWLEQR